MKNISHRLARITFLVALPLALASCGSDSRWGPIDRCVLGIDVDYDSGTPVGSNQDAAAVFDAYILWAGDHNQMIFGSPASEWSDPRAARDGIYRGRRYWLITARHAGTNEAVFDVDETGRVVRLLGCF